MRWVLSIGAVTAVFSIWANADVESRVHLLECKMKAARQDMAYECREGARFAPGRPSIDSYGFWVVGNVLYWTAYEGGTEIAYRENNLASTPFPQVMTSVNFEWDVGYRIGAGWATAHDNMEFGVIFTRVEPEGEFSAHTSAPNAEQSVIVPVGITTYTSASAHWNLKYSVLDVEFARSYFVSRYFYLRPYFGSRTAWIDQDANLQFKGGGNPITKGTLRNDFKGSGLRFGTDSRWFFARHWNLFLGASASALYGKFTVATRANQAANGDDIASSLHRIAMAAQTQIGLGWETAFSCNSNQIAINLGYELNYWWRQNQQPVLEQMFGSVYGARQSQDLAFHGMTIDMQLSF